MANNTSQKLAQQIWAIANDLRGNMDSSKFKDYILGVIFYRFLSQRTESYTEDLLKNDHITYEEALQNPTYAKIVKEWLIEKLGYVIEPQYLFDSLVHKIKDNTFSVEIFQNAVSKLIDSTIGQESESAFANLFDAMDLTDSDLGKEVSDRTDKMANIIKKIADTTFAKSEEDGDILGTAYMILIGLFQSNAGKKGGEFFTPTCISSLLSQISTIGLNEIKNVSDGCAGSGSLLLEVKRHLSSHQISHFYGQEKVGTTYNLLRMNLIMHGIPYKEFTVYNDDTLTRDNFYENGKPIEFDVQVENPPYSTPNTASDSKYLDDERYRPVGVLAPKTKADLAFVLGMVYHMADDGRVAVLLPHGALFRGGNEQIIRKYLVDTCNVVDTIIGLPAKLFHGTGIPVSVWLLKKKRNGNSDNILFIDASNYFEKIGKNNALRTSDVKRIVDCVKERVTINKFSRVVPIEEIKTNDYNMNIPRYVDSSEKEENWDIYSLMFGGVPPIELDQFEDFFNSFTGLKDELFEFDGESYRLVTDDIKKTVYDNKKVKQYIDNYKSIIENMRTFLRKRLIDNVLEVDNQTEESVLTNELFKNLEDIQFIDKYDVYQLLSDEWLRIAIDIDIIQKEGLSSLNVVEPNMVSKKDKSVEVQEGYKGKVLPFELVQRLKQKELLDEIVLLESQNNSYIDQINEIINTLSDEEKNETYGKEDRTLISEKNEIVSKALDASIKEIKSEYGKSIGYNDFEEDEFNYKLLKIKDLLNKYKSINKSIKEKKLILDNKTQDIVKNLSQRDSLILLEEKWISPFIDSISNVAQKVIDSYIKKLNQLQKKYATSYKKEQSEIRTLENSLANIMEELEGSNTDIQGIKELIGFFRGV